MAKFYQAVLKEVKGNVLDHVYPHLKGPGQLTMKERLGSDEGLCPECGQAEWMLYPKEAVIVAQGGKPYIECLECGHVTHL